jgi:hypothetical protein
MVMLGRNGHCLLLFVPLVVAGPAGTAPEARLGKVEISTSAKSAAEQFARALFRHPGRARSLLGAARAAARQGKRAAAAEHYSRFLRQWEPADRMLPELREAQDYLKQADRPPRPSRTDRVGGLHVT